MSVCPSPAATMLRICGDLSPQERGEVLSAAFSSRYARRIAQKRRAFQHLAPLLRGEVAAGSLREPLRRVRGTPTRFPSELFNRATSPLWTAITARPLVCDTMSAVSPTASRIEEEELDERRRRHVGL